MKPKPTNQMSQAKRVELQDCMMREQSAEIIVDIKRKRRRRVVFELHYHLGVQAEICCHSFTFRQERFAIPGRAFITNNLN